MADKTITSEELAAMAKASRAKECVTFLKENFIPEMKERRLKEMISCPRDQAELIYRQQRLAVLDELLRELQFIADRGDDITNILGK